MAGLWRGGRVRGGRRLARLLVRAGLRGLRVLARFAALALLVFVAAVLPARAEAVTPTLVAVLVAVLSRFWSRFWSRLSRLVLAGCWFCCCCGRSGAPSIIG